jgi:hypothetical protein
VAKRYSGSPSLASDADKLVKIAKSDTVNGLQLTEATQTVAALCGHPFGLNALLPNDYGSGGSTWDSQPTATTTIWPSTSTPAPWPSTPTTTAPSTSATTAPTSQTTSAPGGLRVALPAGWVVTDGPVASNLQASDPADPVSFARFGGAPPPAVGLLAEIQSGERTNPNVRNGYHRIRLEPRTFLGTEAVDWELTFVKEGVTRHALGRYWRSGGYGYVIYVSSPEVKFSALRPVFDLMADTVTVP